MDIRERLKQRLNAQPAPEASADPRARIKERIANKPPPAAPPPEPTGMDWTRHGANAIFSSYTDVADFLQKDRLYDKMLARNLPENYQVQEGQVDMHQDFLDRRKKQMDEQSITGRLKSFLGEDTFKRATERVIPRGQHTGADALWSGLQWSSPLGKATKLDPLMGLFAAGGEAALGEGGEMAGLVPLLWQAAKGTPAAIKKLTELDQHTIKRVVDWMKGQTHGDFDKVIATLEDAQKGGMPTGTLADVAGDAGLANLEKAVPAGSKTAHKLDEIAEARQAETTAKLRAGFDEGGDAAAAVPQQESRLREARKLAREQPERRLAAAEKESSRLEAGVQERLNAEEFRVAEQLGEQEQSLLAKSRQREEAVKTGLEEQKGRLTAAEAAAKPDTTAIGASEAMTAGYKELKKTIQKDLLDPVWRRFKKGKRISPVEMQETLAETLRTKYGMSDYQVAEVTESKPISFMFALDSADNAPSQLHSIVSDLKARGVDAKGKGDGQLAKFYGDASSVIDDYIEKNSGGRYKLAREQTVRSKEILGDRKIAKILAKEDPTTVASKVFKRGDAGAEMARSVLGAVKDDKFKNTQIVEEMEQYILNQAQKAKDPDKFLDDYDGFFEVWSEQRPELAQKLQNVADQRAATLAKTKSVEDATQAEALERVNIEKSIQKEQSDRVADLTKAANAEIKALASKAGEKAGKIKQRGKEYGGMLKRTQLSNFVKAPQKTIREALTGENKTAFKRLASSFKDPKAKADFMALVGDTLSEMQKSSGGLSAGKNYDHIQARLNEVFDKKQMDALAENKARDDFARIKNKASREAYQNNPSLMAEDLGASFGTLLVLKMFDPQNALLIGGAIRRNTKRVISKMKGKGDYDKRVNDFVEEMITDPNKIVDIVKGMGLKGNEKFTRRQVNRIVRTLMRSAEATPQMLKGAVQASDEEE